MKLIQTVVSAEGFRDEAGNRERAGLLHDLVRLCGREAARLLIIPAGFLTAASEDAVAGVVQEVQQIAESGGVAVIGGIDVVGPVSKKSQSLKDLVRSGRLPFFGFATGPGVLKAGGSHLWRQTSTDNSNADLVPDCAIPGEDRVVTINGVCITVLICGELFSSRARSGVARAEVDLVVDLGHWGMGQGLIPAMRCVAKEAECPVAHTQHLSAWSGRSLHFVDVCGKQQSMVVEVKRIVQRGSLWAGWMQRTF